jgi:hypothetical protein
MVTSQMPASVYSLANATRKPNGNVDAVILHYKAINAELETQLAVACAQRDALSLTLTMKSDGVGCSIDFPAFVDA